MATTVTSPLATSRSLPGRRYDHRFFTAMAVVMLLTVLYGFSRTYFLAGGFRAPLPSRIIHVHAVVFTSWILFLILQTSLTSTGNVQLHRRLGIGGFALACLMLPVGLLAATDSLVRGLDPLGRDPRVFYIVPTTGIIMFSVLVGFAFRYRKDPATHKRLIYVATASIMLAAIARMPVLLPLRNPLLNSVGVDLFLISLASYDFWSTRRVHRATLYAGLAVFILQAIRVPLGHTSAWIQFADWIRSIAA